MMNHDDDALRDIFFWIVGEWLRVMIGLYSTGRGLEEMMGDARV